MGTTTARLSLYKPLTDGSELVNVATDLDANYDKIDLAVGFQSCTSSTRPSTPYSGKPIAQSDTAYSTYFSNGTAPASGSWLEIPNSSSTFGSNLKLSASSQLVIGVDTNLFRNAANTLRTNDALIVDGALTASSTLAVTGAATLNSTLAVTGDLTVGATTWQTYVPTIANQGTAVWGQQLGWYKKLGKIVLIEIYLAASAVGSGTTPITITLPSTPYRDGGGAATTRQFIGAHAGGVGAGTNVSVSGAFTALIFAGGVGAVIDRISGPTAIDMRGENISATLALTIQGWYREA